MCAPCSPGVHGVYVPPGYRAGLPSTPVSFLVRLLMALAALKRREGWYPSPTGTGPHGLGESDMPHAFQEHRCLLPILLPATVYIIVYSDTYAYTLNPRTRRKLAL